MAYKGDPFYKGSAEQDTAKLYSKTQVLVCNLRSRWLSACCFCLSSPHLGDRAKVVSGGTVSQGKTRAGHSPRMGLRRLEGSKLRILGKRAGFIAGWVSSQGDLVSLGWKQGWVLTRGFPTASTGLQRHICHRRLLMRRYINIWLLLNTKQNKKYSTGTKSKPAVRRRGQNLSVRAKGLAETLANCVIYLAAQGSVVPTSHHLSHDWSVLIWHPCYASNGHSALWNSEFCSRWVTIGILIQDWSISSGCSCLCQLDTIL